MGNFLTIDQGNTNAKVAVWTDAGDVIFSSVFDDLSMMKIEPVLSEFDVKRASLAVSGRLNKEFFSQLQSRLDGRAVVISEMAESSFKIITSYKGKLGIDRFMNYIGTVDLYPFIPSLIVDAGSALTIDVVDRDCCFRGGNISPGYVMRFEVLNEKTNSLPLLPAGGHVRSFGINTKSAIRSGVIMGMVAEIADSFYRAKKTYKTSQIILTGGDVEYLLPHLESRGLPLVVEPLLVSRGIFALNNPNKNSLARISV